MGYTKKELINKLKNTTKKIKINNKIFKLQKSEFIDYLNNDTLKKIDNQLNSGCINDTSLYELSEKTMIDGFNVCILNNVHIYRTYLGFLNKKIQDEYVRKNINNPIYFANKYLCYAFARTIWGGIHSFKLKKKIVLIDFFDEHNIKLILSLADKYITDEHTLTIFKKTLIISTGYNLSFKKQIDNYVQFMDEIESSSELYLKQKVPTYHYCKDEKSNFNFMQLRRVEKEKIFIDKVLRNPFFEYILPHFKNINGMIYKQTESLFMKGGRYWYEEILLNGTTFLENLEFDSKDEICWTNYGLKKNYRNINLKFNMSEIGNMLDYNGIPKNNKFSLFDFYKDNKMVKYTQINKTKKYILTFNVHSFVNLSLYILKPENINNLLKWFNHYKNYIEIIFFQEYKISDKELNEYFINEMNKLGYIHNIFALNGTEYDDLKIACFTKEKYKYEIIDTTKKEHINHILLYYKSLTICCVHLSIGDRLFINNYTANKNIIEKNSNIRINQIHNILKYDPDMIIGDFNFTTNDLEHKELLNHKYYHLNNDNDKSTPYNRVDHVYYNKDIKLENKLLICNYSDHVPLIQEIPNI
jgi:hypothetical protein